MNHLNILVIGDEKAGKTTLIHSFIYQCNSIPEKNCKHC